MTRGVGESSSRHDLCRSCSVDLISPLVCVSCGSFQGFSDVDPFEALGLDHAYPLDRADLKKRLLRLSRHTHPDFFASSTAEERQLAEEASARLNESYKLLLDDRRRADWLVRRLGGPDERQERAMPQSFLMEVLEWNETLEEGRSAQPGSPERDALERLASELASQREETMARIAAALDPLPARGAEALTTVRRELNAVRYIDRALREIRELRLTGA